MDLLLEILTYEYRQSMNENLRGMLEDLLCKL